MRKHYSILSQANILLIIQGFRDRHSHTAPLDREITASTYALRASYLMSFKSVCS